MHAAFPIFIRPFQIMVVNKFWYLYYLYMFYYHLLMFCQCKLLILLFESIFLVFKKYEIYSYRSIIQPQNISDQTRRQKFHDR